MVFVGASAALAAHAFSRSAGRAANLSVVAADVRAARIAPPAVVVVGEVVAMRDALSWYETKPLFGWRNFLVGTVLGLAPGVITTSVFIDRAIAAIREPAPATFAILAVIVAAIVALAWAIRRILRARGDIPRTPPVVMHGS